VQALGLRGVEVPVVVSVRVALTGGGSRKHHVPCTGPHCSGRPALRRIQAQHVHALTGTRRGLLGVRLPGRTVSAADGVRPGNRADRVPASCLPGL